MNLKKFIKIKLLAFILINYNSFCMENSYSDIQSMLLDIKPFEHEIDYGFLNVEYTNQRVSNITWFDEDSINWISDRYSKPDIKFYESPVVVDNEKKQILS